MCPLVGLDGIEGAIWRLGLGDLGGAACLARETCGGAGLPPALLGGAPEPDSLPLKLNHAGQSQEKEEAI